MEPLDPSLLLSSHAFARRIALGLLRDRERADDLVQELWVEVLEKHPAASSPEGFLAALLRRLSYRKRRSESRRKERERAVGARTAHGDTAALVARAEIHRRTVAAVLALDEPYRSTVLLRFYEDCTAPEIAARQGIPVETARTRLKRALAMLRARLEGEGRDWREEWVLALTGASAPREPGLKSAAPLAGGAIAAVALVVWSARTRLPEAAATPDRAAAEVARVEPRDSRTAPAGFEDERVALEAKVLPRAAAPEPTLAGRILDELGAPLGGVRVQLAITRFGYGHELAAATSDDAGAFACALSEWYALSPVARGLLGLEVEAWKSGRVALRQHVEIPLDGPPGELDLVLPPGRLLSGRILLPADAPIALTGVVVRTTGRNGSTAPHELAGPASRDGWFGFGLEEGERVLEVRAHNTALGFVRWTEGSFSAATTGDVVLPALPLSRGSVVRGRCVHLDGTPVRSLPLVWRQVEPVPGGGFRRVAGGTADCRATTEALTDELGRFEAAGLCRGSFQPFYRDDEDEPLGRGAVFESDGSEIELVLEGVRLRVQVVDPAGSLLEEARLAFTRLAGDGTVQSIHRTFTTRTPPATSLRVVAGETLAVLVAVPGCAVVEERFVVPADTLAPELRVELVPESRSATLLLQPSRGPSSGWSVDLCSPLTGLAIPGWQDLVADAEGRVSDLPVGSYRVRVEPTVAKDGACPEWCALDAGEPVTLVAGETRVAFEAVRAARVRVLFTDGGPTGEPAPLEDLEAKYSASAQRYDWLNLSLLPARGRLELWPVVAPVAASVFGTSEPLRRVRDVKPAAGRYFEWIAPALPVRLRVVLRGGEPFERELSPLPGETLEVPVPLPPDKPGR